VIALVEDVALALVLCAMMLLPLIEVVVRRLFHTGIEGAAIIVQHLGLVAAMLGGAVAAREGRLVSLSTLGHSALRGRAHSLAQMLGGAVGGLVTGFLSLASLHFVVSERPFSKSLVYGIPIWVVELALPIGFALICVRLIHRAAEGWPARFAVSFGGLAAAVALSSTTPAPAALFVTALVGLLVATVLGTPAFVTLGGIALILFWRVGEPIASISVSHYSLVTNPSIPALPLFTLAGYWLAESHAPQRLVRVFDALFGRLRGGPAIVTVVVCSFFTSFTGASGVTILALGGLLMPILTSARYTEQNALGLITGAGSLGMLLPPCLPLIVYAVVARIPVEQIFLGGLAPAVLMSAATGWWGMTRGPALDSHAQRFDAREASRALWNAKWELLTPAVAFVALFSGWATTVEAAALTAFYVALIETVVHRDLSLAGLSRVFSECGLLIGSILLILGVALGFTNYLVNEEIPARAVLWTTSTVHSPMLFLLLLNLFLILVGCLMDVYSAIIIQVPLLVPLGQAYGIDPVQLGIIFLANLELGYLTPPVGLNVYMASYRFGKSVPAVFRAALPIVVVLHIGVLLITYVPWLTTLLPRLFARGN